MIFRLAVAALLVSYPLLVWFGLARLGAPALLGLLLALLGLRMLAVSRRGVHARLAGVVMIAAGVLAAMTDSGNESLLRWYPVLASLFASGVFAVSLVSGRPLIERIARLRHPVLSPAAVVYTRRLTWTWAGITFANALVAAWTAMFASLALWAFYNGVLSYLLLGGFFCAEWLYRRRHLAEA